MLIVETGAGLINSNSYASLEAADAFAQARGIVSWFSIERNLSEAALIRATDYIDYRYRFFAAKRLSTQSLANPIVNQTTLPPELVRATIELAIASLETPLFEADPNRDIAQKAEELEGVGSESVVYRTGKRSDPFPHVTEILNPIAKRKGAGGISTGRLIK